jgi:hypothetical protein
MHVVGQVIDIVSPTPWVARCPAGIEIDVADAAALAVKVDQVASELLMPLIAGILKLTARPCFHPQRRATGRACRRGPFFT